MSDLTPDLVASTLNFFRFPTWPQIQLKNESGHAVNCQRRFCISACCATAGVILTLVLNFQFESQTGVSIRGLSKSSISSDVGAWNISNHMCSTSRFIGGSSMPRC